MSAINTKIKTFILTAISAAILSACGGGGGGGNAALSTGSTNTAGSGSPEKNGGKNNNNNIPPSNTHNNNESPVETTNNKADKLEELTDEKPISPLNAGTPLSTSFISSASAQQSNPNVQLRRNNDTNKLFYTDNQTNNQNGLVSSLDFKANDEVKLDAIVLYNKTEEGNATQVQFTTTDSIIAKAFSGGKTKSDVSEQTGQEPNNEFKVGQSTLDKKIVGLYTKSENAKSALASAERKLANDTNAFAEALKNKTQAERQASKAYNSMLGTLYPHSTAIKNAAAKLDQAEAEFEAIKKDITGKDANKLITAQENVKQAKNALEQEIAASKMETAPFEKAKKELEEAKANFKAAIEKTTGDSVEELENANKALNTAQDELDKQISALTKNLNKEDLAKFKVAKNNWENAEENLQSANQNVISAKATRTSSKDARDAAEKTKNTAAKAYDDARQVRQDLTELAENHANQLAYIAKDKNGTVFDKRFDGIYIIRFANGTATYNGLTTAYVVKNNNQSRQLTADVKAIVDFGLKGVRFETANSQFHSLDANGRRVTKADEKYDMQGTAKWENGNLFLGKVEAASAGLKGNLSGKFFGPSAAEIGGTYGLKKEDGSEHMIGGYGAKRQ